MSLQLPPSFKPLEALAANYERQHKARQQAAAELRRLDDELRTAAEKDRRAFADRLAKDVSAKNPGDREQEKVRAKIAETKARYNALADTVADAKRAVDEEIEANAAKWLAAENAAAEKARLAYAEAVETLVGKREELDSRTNLVRWLKNPGQPFKFIPQPVHARALLKPSGQPLEFVKLIGALREDAKPPEQRESLLPHRIWPPRQPAQEPELDHVA